MAAIPLERYETTLTILNPQSGFAAEEHKVEVRKDPLLGDTSIYNPFLRDKARLFYGRNDDEILRRLAEEPPESCLFCGENVLQKTARYADYLAPGGRIEIGEAVLFANLFSLAAYHPVIVLSKAHFLRPSQLDKTLLADGFKAARDFLRNVYQADPTVTVATVNANYLFPAGASIVHPHMQMLVTPVPYSYHARLLNASVDYLYKNGTSYFADLIAQEMKTGERYIAKRGRWHWISAFSPVGCNEITGIHEAASDLAELTVRDLRDLGEGIANVLALIEAMGHLSFNFTLYTAKGGEAVGFRCFFRIVTRQNLYPNYRNDDYFMQKMLQSELIFTLPEDLAIEARKYFGRNDGS